MGRSKPTARRLHRPFDILGMSRKVHEDGKPNNPLNAFIDFLSSRSDGEPVDQPSAKRQKTSSITEKCENIVVRRTKFNLNLHQGLAENFEGPIERRKVPILVKITEIEEMAYHIKIYDLTDKYHKLILDVTLSADGNIPLQDIQIATLVAAENESWQNPLTHGRLWVETDIRLTSDKSFGSLEISLCLKWNTTPFVYNIPPRRVKRPGLQAVLDAYYPQDSREKGEISRSAQSFYDSVYTPNKEDHEAASIITEHLDTELYPFQKRTVRWLLEREGVRWSNVEKCVLPQINHRHELPYSFREVRDATGQVCYISHFYSVVVMEVEAYRHLDLFRGGILAEEMGLGKTVEMIALISLHRQPENVLDCKEISSENLISSPATLIITPPSILPQWISELQRHSPTLKVFHYQGIKWYPDLDHNKLIDKLKSYDVVFTTYNILSAEIHYSLPTPDRQLRTEKRYVPPKSPLTKILWWRVCLDEAQMIESGVSNAATVAKLIPRVLAWCVTGTPVQRNLTDLLGLLVFLRLEPFVSMPHLWSSLVLRNQSSFHTIFNTIALRHTKQSVRDELRLPLQKRFIITMSFTPVEEQYYQSIFQQMCEDCGVDSSGNPINQDWDPENPTVVDKMRAWLMQLRQTALHPDIGGRNRRTLGRKNGPLRTVDDVLAAMLEQSEVIIRIDQRTLLLSKLKRGQKFENGPEVQKALAIWTEVLGEAGTMVLECRQQLHDEIIASGMNRETEDNSSDTADASENDKLTNTDDNSAKASTRISIFRNRLRDALEVEHIATFFQANGYFQLKSDQNLTTPKSQEFNDLEKLETEGYERAKRIRQEILKEILKKVNKLMEKVTKKTKSQSFVQIPDFPSTVSQAGIESRRIMEQINELGIALDAQANYLDEWREQAIKLLLEPLVDEDEGVEITGEEYGESTKTQELVLILVQALRTVIEDRYDALSGQENLLVKEELKTAKKFAEDGEGPFPAKFLELFKIREEIKPLKEQGSIREFISGLRALSTALKLDADNGSSRAANELSIVEKERQKIQKQYSEQSKAVTALKQEIDLFTNLLNTRLEYYRQLQQLSDTVKPLEDSEKLKLMNLEAEEEKLTRKIAVSTAKRRYLIHLRDETSADSTQQKTCVICQSTFEIGALTVCGHQFCKECIGLWWNAHRNCPVCKRHLTKNDLHDITYKPQELKMSEEVVDVAFQARSLTADSDKSTIYSEINGSNTFAQIKDIDLDGPSFTTKISTLARHLLWLREQDPGAKSIIFSQFKEFLDVLSRALTNYRISFSTIDKPNGVQRFKQDPGIECFLLHAKAHSSGLNLVNASHVFLCEPLINTALELQAIARVHRIGQQQTTTVWLYMIDGTVEESIYEISVQRRLEHIGRNGKGKGVELTPEVLDESNSMELQDAALATLLTKGRTGGEYVEMQDLWSCLFGNSSKRNRISEPELADKEIVRHLRAEAVEERHLQVQVPHRAAK